MELGKNPGLGSRELHQKGITGKGVGIAIIDQSLLVDHVEYKEQLKMYEEIHCYDERASMHGPAVASIAVGKTVGVALEADLYYIAETHGIYTIYVGSKDFMGLGRNPLIDADDITSYGKGEYWKKGEYYNNALLIPMDSRCTASPTGINDYVYYREGGMSWTVPYLAGLYALACQVNPDIILDVFFFETLNTSDTVIVDETTGENC